MFLGFSMLIHSFWNIRVYGKPPMRWISQRNWGSGSTCSGSIAHLQGSQPKFGAGFVTVSERTSCAMKSTKWYHHYGHYGLWHYFLGCFCFDSTITDLDRIHRQKFDCFGCGLRDYCSHKLVCHPHFCHTYVLSHWQHGLHWMFLSMKTVHV